MLNNKPMGVATYKTSAEMPEEFMVISYQEGTERGVCDYLSGMTDRYAIRLFLRLFVPEGFPAIK